MGGDKKTAGGRSKQVTILAFLNSLWKGKTCQNVTHLAVSQHQLRAEMSKTPKKIWYVASSNATTPSRLFKSVGDFSHCKNSFGKANHALHLAAEEIYGSSLRRSELFLHLRCRPGKRRLKNFIALYRH